MKYKVDASELIAAINALSPISDGSNLCFKFTPEEVMLEAESTVGYLLSTTDVIDSEDLEEGKNPIIMVLFSEFQKVLINYAKAYRTELKSVAFEFIDEESKSMKVIFHQVPKEGQSAEYDKEVPVSFNLKQVLSSTEGKLKDVDADTEVTVTALALYMDTLKEVLAAKGIGSGLNFFKDDVVVEDNISYAIKNVLGDIAEDLDGVRFTLREVNILSTLLKMEDASDSMEMGVVKGRVSFRLGSIQGVLKTSSCKPLYLKKLEKFDKKAIYTIDRLCLVDVLNQVAVSSELDNGSVYLKFTETGIKIVSGATADSINAEDFEGEVPEEGVTVKIDPIQLSKALLGSNDFLVSSPDEGIFLERVKIAVDVVKLQVSIMFFDEKEAWKSWMKLSMVKSK